MTRPSPFRLNLLHNLPPPAASFPGKVGVLAAVLIDRDFKEPTKQQPQDKSEKKAADDCASSSPPLLSSEHNNRCIVNTKKKRWPLPLPPGALRKIPTIILFLFLLD